MLRDSAGKTCVALGCRLLCGVVLTLAWAGFASVAGHASVSPNSKNVAAPPGIAWDVQGVWRAGADGGPINAGDAVQPGSLLRPEATDSNHSITVFLPDGQRILYECFTVEDCARGFRVPELQRKPAPFAVGMMERILAALTQQQRQIAGISPEGRHIARDEIALVAEAGNRIEIEGLAASLSNGAYFGDLRSFDSRYPERSGISLVKSGRSIALTVPGPGLFLLTIADGTKRPRIEFMIGVAPNPGSGIVKEFQDAHALMEEWNESYQGWPIHDFQRAYLQSVILGIQSLSDSGRQVRPGAAGTAGETAEPSFAPRPAVLGGDAAITLHCATEGATIHYTVDESEPIASSPVYRAPIMVKGTGLTIKAFAESPKKKDSAVVTGIFRIRAQDE